ncbi:hypothetical protein O181_125413 [Austropuccinia psidii MF-1]|uniref:Uncharacterized protein n=1 Tax=Austropuccinia psidii MF-1 TaxID=1389203 RepID=A0A9Q3KQI9_9BASI|nr:hypothetical protein [Austropuccinia psidii MF-1]
MPQLAVQTQEKFDELHRSNLRLQELTISQEETVKAIQESCAELSKASKENNKRLNQVFEEKYHCKRDRVCLDQDTHKLFNVFQNIKPQPQGNVWDNPYHQEDIKPDDLLKNKARSPSQYQDEDKMTYSEKEALKQLPEALNWPKLSGIGEYDHIELINHIDGLFIDVPSIPDYWINARLSSCDSKPEHKHDSQNTINQWYSQDTTKTWS